MAIILHHKSNLYARTHSLLTKTSQLQGDDGKAITQKIDNITKDKPIERWMQSLVNENKKSHNKLVNYVNTLRLETGEEKISLTLLDNALLVWQKLREHFSDKCLEIPDACPGHRSNFMYTWSTGEHYLECEIFVNGDVEFFYKNKKTREIWGEDNSIDCRFSRDIWDKLELFSW